MNSCIRFGLATFMATLFFSGCSNAPDRKWGVGGGSEGAVTDKVMTSCLVNWRDVDGQLFFVMISDGVTGNEASTNKGDSKGKMKTKEGHELLWSCSTSDGKTGKVVIDNQNFELEKGGVFLVLANDNNTTVEQLAVDMAKFQGGPVDRKVRVVAETEPRIAAFLEASRKKR